MARSSGDEYTLLGEVFQAIARAFLDPEAEAQRRIEAAEARLRASPELEIDAPRARLPGDVVADDDDEYRKRLPSPPRIDGDPFRSPPQPIVVVQAAPVKLEAPKIVPRPGDDPKLLR